MDEKTGRSSGRDRLWPNIDLQSVSRAALIMVK